MISGPTKPVQNSLFFFNDTATTEIYTLSLHDALPISAMNSSSCRCGYARRTRSISVACPGERDRKSTRLNSSHVEDLVCRLLLEKKKKHRDHDEADRNLVAHHLRRRAKRREARIFRFR